jgi:4-alpha-glucanotransferase
VQVDGKEGRERKGKEGKGKEGVERATRLPSDFQISDEWVVFCQTERKELDPQTTFVKIRDYWTAKAGKDGAKLDWFATWRNWVREERGKQVSEKKSYAEQQRDRIAEFTGKSTIQGEANVIAITSY